MDDLISRQALRDAMYHEAFETDSDMQRWDSGCWIRYKMFENVIDSLPSAQPERKKGKWIKRGVSLYRCSECGRFSPAQENHCPNCGADKRGDKDAGIHQ